MSLNRKFLSLTIILLVITLACSGVDTAPPGNPPTPLPVSTATPGSGSDPAVPGNLESAKVASVLDGDTIQLTDGRRVRYIGINTPERDQPYYKEATATNRQLVEGQSVQLELDVETFDKYGRTLAYVWVGGQMANLAIVRQGFANAFTVPPNIRYQTQFRDAEREAREAGRGLWAGSTVPLKIVRLNADAPGNDRDNPNGEWIEIANQGRTAVLMRGYTLKDAANHIYAFGDFSVRPGTSFILYSGQGQDSATALYWGLVGESVWNNDSDSAFLRDDQGALIDSFSY